MKSLRAVALFAGICPIIILLLLIVLRGDRQYNNALAMLWSLGQVGVLCCLWLLHVHCLNGKHRFAKIALFICGLGALSYIIGDVNAVFFKSGVRIFMPLGALLSTIGMMLVGIQVIRADNIRGTNRYAALTVGLYPLLVMFPLLIITGHPDLYAIMGWGLPWLWLALVTTRYRSQPEAGYSV